MARGIRARCHQSLIPALTSAIHEMVHIPGPKLRRAYFATIPVSVLSRHLTAWQKLDTCPQSPQTLVSLPLPQDSMWAWGLYHAMVWWMKHGALWSWVWPVHAGVSWDICGPDLWSSVDPGHFSVTPPFSLKPLRPCILCVTSMLLSDTQEVLSPSCLSSRRGVNAQGTGYSSLGSLRRYTHHTARFCYSSIVHTWVAKNARSHGPLPCLACEHSPLCN